MTGGAPAAHALTTVVVTYNSAALLPDLFRSLDDGLAGLADPEVVVVDNASSDGSADEAGRLCHDALVLRAPGNLGFAAGINLAVRERRGHGPVLILNPDVRLTPGAGRRLLEALGEPGVGIAVPRVVDEHGALQFSLRREPTIARALGEALAGGGRAGRAEFWGESVTNARAYDTDTDADWATGAALLVSPRCLEAVGAWDESFFLYSEETDFALRARDAGFRLRYVADAVVVHLGGDAHRSPRLWSLLATNRVRLYRKRHGPLAAGAFRAAVLVNEALRCRTATHRAACRALLSIGGRPA